MSDPRNSRQDTKTREETDRLLAAGVPTASVLHLILFGVCWMTQTHPGTPAQWLVFLGLTLVQTSRLIIAQTRPSSFRPLFVGLTISGALLWSLALIASLETGDFLRNSLPYFLGIAGAAAASTSSLFILPWLSIATLFAFIAPASLGLALLSTEFPPLLTAALWLFLFFSCAQVIRNGRSYAQGQSARRNSENDSALLTALLDGIPGMVSLVDEDLRYRLGNKKFAGLPVFADKGFLGSQLGSVSGDQTLAQEVRALLAPSAPAHRMFEHQTLGLAGAPWHLFALQRFELDGKPAVIVLAIDISHQKKTESELEQQRVAIFETRRLATMSEMAGGLAHEINNPLAIVQGRAEQIVAISKSPPIDGTRLELHAERILAASKRIAHIIRALRSIARDASQDTPEAASITETLTRSAELIRARFSQQGIQLRFTHPPQEVHYLGRPGEVIQVMTTLLNQSFTAVQELSDRWVNVTVEDLSSQVCVRITDSSPRPHPEILARLSEIHLSLSQDSSGFALAFSLARAVIQSQGGTLRPGDDPEHAQVVLTLPKTLALPHDSAA